MIVKYPLVFLFLILYLFSILAQFMLVHSAYKFSSLKLVDNQKKSLRIRTRFIPPLFLHLAFWLLLFAAAGFEKIEGFEQNKKEGYAVQLVLDRSSSMTVDAGDGKTRYYHAINAAKSFVLGDPEIGLDGRKDDLIGLVSYAGYPETVYPLSLNHNLFDDTIDLLRTATPRTDEDGTNIGDALASAVARLVLLNEQDDYNVKGRFVILLTDGSNNRGKVAPAEAAEYAAESGIKVYTINFYTGRVGIFEMSDYANATKTLENIAEVTGGKYFQADSPRALNKVYKEIDSIEKSSLQEQSNRKTRPLYKRFLIPGLIFLILYGLLITTIYRRLP
ncbi:MAG: VWA domain-containing protein [Spirochaetales bacterium]|nr:VWA domain-containing protein [Spirochaetales bacterium]